MKMITSVTSIIAAAIAFPVLTQAQIGWTKEQIQHKYGKPVDAYRGWYSLSPAKFSGLYSGGFNRISFEFYEGKVARMGLHWAGYDPTMKEEQGDHDQMIAKMRAWDGQHRGTMTYETAKEYALSYIEANPDMKAVKNETKHDSYPTPGTWPFQIADLDYKGWHFHWYQVQYNESPLLYNQTFEISPSSNTALAKEWGAIRAQQSSKEQAKDKASHDSSVKSETR